MIDSIFRFALRVELALVGVYLALQLLELVDRVIGDWYLRFAGWTR